MNLSFRGFGSRALLVEVPAEVAASGAKMRALREHVATRSGLDVVVGDGVLLVFGKKLEGLAALLEEELARELSRLPAREHLLDVLYDGVDLAEVAARVGVTSAALIEMHSASTYEVGFLGFMPGFPYLRGLDSRLAVPRRKEPRTRVLAGSVAIAANYAGIYPFDGPGGWNLLGRLVGGKLFDTARTRPGLLLPGDTVRFRALEYAPRTEPIVRERPAEPVEPALRILRAPPLTTIQDEGRFGKLGYGLPPSGPVDPDFYRKAVNGVGARGSAAIEFSSGALHLEALLGCTLSIDGEVRRMSRGETLVIEETNRLYRYVALEGGIDVPEILGSHSTLLLAKLGGFLGRNLRSGDVLGRGKVDVRSFEDVAIEREVFVEPGPDYERFSDGVRRKFFESTFEIGGAFDRTGVRLGGPKLGANELGSGRSIPMIRGAIQVTPDGTPIVLGPDHPTTGGYPVLAVLAEESFGAFGRLRPGARVRFEPKISPA